MTPHATPARRKPAGTEEPSSTTWPGWGTQRELKKPPLTAVPIPSSKPNIRLRLATACDEVPFHRLSIAANTKSLPVRSSAWTLIAQTLVSRTSRTPGRAGDELDEGLLVVAARVELLEGVLREGARRRHVARQQLALIEREQVRHEDDRHRRAERPSSWSISGMWRCRATP